MFFIEELRQADVVLFEKTFETKLSQFCDITITMLAKKFKFDVIAFDHYVHKYLGYEEDIHGSLFQFVEAKEVGLAKVIAEWL